MSSNKKDILLISGFIFSVPVILTIIMIMQWEEENSTIMSGVLGFFWIAAFVLIYIIIKGEKKNLYQFHYLIDYNTLIMYMREEEQNIMKLREENILLSDSYFEGGFHFFLYKGKEKIEIQAWHHSFSNLEEERIKGDVYCWNKEEFNSLDSLIENKIKKFDGYVLIELIDSDSVMLNEFKNNHKELDVASYIEKLK